MRLGGRLVFPAVFIAALQLAIVAPANAGTAYVGAFNTTGSVGTLHGPWGMAVDDLGNVYIADTGAHRIVKFDKNGQPLIAFGMGGSDTEGQKGHLYYPTGITFANNLLYVVDASSTVNVFSTGGYPQAQWGVPGTAAGQLNVPAGIGSDCGGNIYVANSRNNRVDEFDPNGNPIKAFGIGKLGVPTGVVVQSIPGNPCIVESIFVSDEYSGDIAQFSGDGQYVATIGTPGTGPMQFEGPEELALTHDLNETADWTMWVAESGNARVQQLVSTDGGSTWSYGGEINSGGSERFPSTHAVASMPDGQLVVAPTSGHIFEYADKPPALTLTKTNGRKELQHTHSLRYEMEYNQLNKTCNVVLTALVDVPNHAFTLKAHVPGVGTDIETKSLSLSPTQFGFVERAWQMNRKIPVHATATGSCSDGVHVTKKYFTPTL